MHYIYGLFDPETKELKYIGYTSRFSERYKEHHDLKRLISNTYKNNWIKSLLKKGLKAEIDILQECKTAEELPYVETVYVAFYKELGAILTNGTKGGDGGATPLSEEGRKRLSESKLGSKNPNFGKIPSEKIRKQRSDRMKGKPSYAKGKKWSEESKLK